jgi:hypothetical protein
VSADIPFSPLLADILTARAAETARATNSVIDNLERQLDDERARRAAVENTILDLISGPYVPHPDRIRQALLFPSAEAIDYYRKGADS